jgi:galactokinase/mevalonate kinase-like predicted kinase
VGSGLGGSAVVLSAIIGCFNQLREDPWGRHEIAELAFQAERIYEDARWLAGSICNRFWGVQLY